MVGPYDDENSAFVKVASTITIRVGGRHQGHNIMNMDRFNALPSTIRPRSKPRRTTFSWVTQIRLRQCRGVEAAIGGAPILSVPQEVLEACYSAANEIYAI